MNCNVWGCEAEAIVTLEYKDSIASTCSESRCPTCARKIWDSEDATVSDEDWHVAGHPAEKSTLDEAEKEELISGVEENVIYKYTCGFDSTSKASGDLGSPVVEFLTVGKKSNRVEKLAIARLSTHIGCSRDRAKELYSVSSTSVEYANTPWDSLTELVDVIKDIRGVRNVRVTSVYNVKNQEVIVNIEDELADEIKKEIKEYYEGLNIREEPTKLRVEFHPK